MALFKVLLVVAALVAASAARPGGLLGGLGGLGLGESHGHGHGHAESYASQNLLSSLGLGHGGLGGGELGGGYKGEEEHIILAHPKYEYKYGVEDSHTGDYKDAKEERDGDIVKGEYSLLQPDGRKRIVHYTSSKHGGFNAIVSYSGHAIHPEVHHGHGHGL